MGFIFAGNDAYEQRYVLHAGRVFDAVEKAGTDVMSRSSSVTQDFVNYR